MSFKFKKSMNIVSVLLLILLLSSCFGSSDEDISKAKKDLLETQQSGSLDSTGSQDWWEVVPDEQEFKQVEITPLTEEQFVELDDLSDEDFSDWEVEIKWRTLTDVDKISISFENTDSEFPADKYDLKQFKSGDKDFMYRAFSRYESFDYGKNVYIIEAHSWDKVSKLQLIINLKLEEDTEASEEVKDVEKNKEDETVTSDLSIKSLPTTWKFWNPIDLWSNKFWYSDIKWLEIKKSKFDDLTCENLTTEYTDKIGWYFFWNTCRPISTDKWISFFIIRLVWSKYYYEKHYYLVDKWVYWIQELETWEWVTKDDLEAKNLELKLKNADYDILKISDDLFKEIVK